MQNVELSISYTTRPIRAGETDGREYRFIDEPDFRRMISEQAFLEWAEVYGNLYGTPRQELLIKKERGVDIILDIDVQGAKNVMQHVSDCVSIFLMPPSLDVLKSRLEARGTDNPEVVEQRFQKAQSEMEQHVNYEYTIKNESLDQSIKEFESIILAERVRTKRLDDEWVHEHVLQGHERQRVS